MYVTPETTAHELDLMIKKLNPYLDVDSFFFFFGDKHLNITSDRTMEEYGLTQYSRVSEKMRIYVQVLDTRSGDSQENLRLEEFVFQVDSIRRIKENILPQIGGTANDKILLFREGNHVMSKILKDSDDIQYAGIVRDEVLYEKFRVEIHPQGSEVVEFYIIPLKTIAEMKQIYFSAAGQNN